MATCPLSRKLFKLDEPDTQDTAGDARTNSSVMYSYGPRHMAKQKQDDQLEHAYSGKSKKPVFYSKNVMVCILLD